MTAQAFSVKSSATNNWLLLGSPILVVLIDHIAARMFVELLGAWAWAGTVLVYWGTLLAIIALFGGMAPVRRWFAKSRGSWLWWVFAIAMGAIGFPLLLIPNLAVMTSALLVILWFLFAIVNATCEELYWRGFLLDATQNRSPWFGVAYSTVLFTANHPAMLGVFSHANTFHFFSHFLSDLGSMSVFVFMNLVTVVPM